MDSPATVPEKKGKGPDKWEIENWARTVLDAEEIKADAEKMKHVKPILEKKVAALKGLSLDGMRAKAQKMVEEEDEDGDEDSGD